VVHGHPAPGVTALNPLPPWLRLGVSPGLTACDTPDPGITGNVTAGESAPIKLTTSGHTVVATLTGDFDMQATFTVEPVLERALQTPGLRRIDLDLHRLHFIDSTGMGVIVRLHAEAQRRGIELQLRRGPPPVHRVFEKTGLAEALPFSAPDGQQTA
jgi:anti-sigma B factor antagonist